MIFTSDVFLLLFLPIVFTIYWLLGRRRPQNLLLVIASYFFYGWWDYRFCFLLWLASTSDFLIAQAMDRARDLRHRKRLVWLSCLLNLSALGFFKYCNFFLESLSGALAFCGWPVDTWTLRILLPLGISFHTFQTLSYVIDVYRGRMPACRDYVTYLAFISFFPQLVAGPIERASHMLPQYERERAFDARLAVLGLELFLWGLFKKIAIADNLAPFADQVFANPAEFSRIPLLFGLVAFAIQIYCDFSGYSEMARGLGFLFGFELMRNFDYPYFSTSMTEFWRRWHISLSAWFRDYVYFPLGGNRVGPVKRCRNIMVTFLTSGLWHGASWNFVIWGCVHGLLVWLESLVRPKNAAREQAPPAGMARAFKMAVTFAIVVLTWIPFRAATLADSWEVLQSLAMNGTGTAALEGIVTLRTGMLLMIGLLGAEYLRRFQETPLTNQSWPAPLRWSAYTAVFWGLVLLVPARMPPFIYFQF